MRLQESGEMYLETILVLSKKLGNVRSLDVAEELGYSKPSVSRAVGVLKNGGFITVDADGHLHLTDEGREIAETIYERHNIITAVLIKLGVDSETAMNDACKIEHDISKASFEAIKHFVEEN